MNNNKEIDVTIVENGETLFWKVYRNKFLNFKIYDILLNQDITDEFKTSIQIHIDNRLKYKDIYSFEWMIENNQFELLKYKINSNQHIELGSKQLDKLVNLWVPHSKSKEEEIKSIFDLLLSSQQFRNDGIDYNSLLQSLLYNDNYGLLETLLKYQENSTGVPLFHITSKHFEYSISKSKPVVIENLIKSIQNSKTSSIKSLVNNYILSDKKLQRQQQPQNRYGFDRVKNMASFSNSIDISRSVSKELLLGYFDLYYKCTNSDPDKSNIQKKIDEILLSPLQVEKQLFKLLVLVTKSKKLYNFYYFNYYETIETDETFGKLNSIPFKKLPSNGVLSKLDSLIANQDKNETIEFLKSFLSQFNFKIWKLRKNSVLINRLVDLIFDIMGDNKEWYERTIQEITNVNKKFSNYLPTYWNVNMKSMLNKDLKFEIQDIETIDWIINNSKSKISQHHIDNSIGPIYFNKIKNGLVDFKDTQLKEYAIIKLDGCKKYYKSHKFQPIKWSQILNNPLQPLFNQFGITNDTILDEQYQNQSNDSTFNLLLYLTANGNGSGNGNEFKIGQNQFEFKPKLIKHFLNQYNTTMALNLPTNCLNEVFKLLFKSILNNDLNLFKILFNSVDPLSFINYSIDKFKRFVDNSNLKHHIKKCEHKTITNIQPENSIEFIQFSINLKVKNGLNYEISKLFFEKLINHLFKTLLQTNGTTIYQVKQMELLMVENGITLEHSLFHSFYYLFIKSKKVIKFVHLTKSLVEKVVIEYDHLDCRCRGQTKGAIGKIIPFSNLIDPNVFTFEYIFGPNGKSFNELLQYFTTFRLELLKTKKITHHESSHFIGYLSYFLNINRIDLFFQHIEVNIHLKSYIFTDKFIFTNLLKRLISTTSDHHQQNMFNTISKFIELVDSSEMVAVYELFLRSIRLYRSDIISFIINHYKIDKIAIKRSFHSLDPSYYNYPMLEYIFINYPNFDVNSIINRMDIPFSSCSLPLFKLLDKYIPNYKFNLFLNQNNLLKAIDKKDFKLLDYFYNIGHLDICENNIYSLKKQ